ncbi:DNA-binding response regulator [Deinococcus malanensis]|uniref:DNA-binding response regulator n=1 Tax=Deinococcus malanensis TaxID=1706855 RepID=A0ABQ2F3G4_9DEIO|nr:DNA-binding response regulator [Deinococcus malanensis]
MPPTILVIKDDLDITRVVQYERENAGYEVLTAADGVGGLTSAHEHHPVLIILDLGLPDMNGVEVARRLRKAGEVRILVLTAVDDVSSKTDLLGVGADDYVTKPFDPPELLARVQVQLRHQTSQDLMTLGLLTVSLSRRLCFYDGHEAPLSNKEFELMALLSQQPGRLYSRDAIVRHLWREEETDKIGLVDVHLGNVRGSYVRPVVMG